MQTRPFNIIISEKLLTTDNSVQYEKKQHSNVTSTSGNKELLK